MNESGTTLDDDQGQYLYCIRTDFSDDDAWLRFQAEADHEYSGAVFVDDRAFEKATLATMFAQLGPHTLGLTVADAVTFSSPEFLTLVCPLRAPTRVPAFRATAALLSSIIPAIWLHELDWDEIASMVDAHGIYRLPGWVRPSERFH